MRLDIRGHCDGVCGEEKEEKEGQWVKVESETGRVRAEMLIAGFAFLAGSSYSGFTLFLYEGTYMWHLRNAIRQCLYY